MASIPMAEEALRTALLSAGIDPTGLNFASLAEIKADTEQKIAALRALPGFDSAVPAFDPPPTAPLPAAGGSDGAS